MKTNPFAFKRAREMMAKIQFIAYNNPPLLASLLIDRIGPYKSRGHGGKFGRHGANVKVYNKMLRHHNRPSFQGAQERLRRVRHANNAGLKASAS